jgi:hypothetical protein
VRIKKPYFFFLFGSLVEVWAMGSKFFKNTTLVVDLVIVATSLYLELIFDNLQASSLVSF